MTLQNAASTIATTGGAAGGAAAATYVGLPPQVGSVIGAEIANSLTNMAINSYNRKFNKSKGTDTHKKHHHKKKHHH